MHATVSDLLLELINNSVQAESSLVLLDIVDEEGFWKFYVSDNGAGMSPESLKVALDPFYSSAQRKRKVGLGLPFVKQAAEAAGGEFSLDSDPSQGTSIFFSLDKNNLDTPPFGDLAGVILAAFHIPGDFEIVLNTPRGTIVRNKILREFGSLEIAKNYNEAKKYLKEAVWAS